MGTNETVRGEKKIDLGGGTWVMRPTFECMIEMEEELGSLYTYVEHLMRTAEFRTKEIAFIIHCGIKGHMGDRAPSFSEVGQWVLDKGLIDVAGEAMDFIQSAMLTEEQAAEVVKNAKGKGRKKKAGK